MASVRGVGSKGDEPVGPVENQRSQRRFSVLLEGFEVGDESIDLVVGEDGGVGGHGGGVTFDYFGGGVENAFAEIGFVGDEGGAVFEFDFAAKKSIKAGRDGSCLGEVAGGASCRYEDLFS